MKIDLLYCIIQYGENWEEAFRKIRNAEYVEWAKKTFPNLKTNDTIEDQVDSLRYALGGKK